jgi:hypothetical protein
MVDVHLRSPLDAKQREAVQLAGKFLLNITQPDLAGIAAKAGYDADEHREGWRWHDVASGKARPFDHFLEGELRRAADDGRPAAARFRELDDFENTWFPLARTAIRRFVDSPRRDAFEQAFFADLQQQPLGPGVVGSVEGLLSRFEALRGSDVPGAADAWRSLVKKGLTDAARARAAALVAEAKAAAEVADDGPADAELRRAAEEQLAAFERLSLWFADWAATLRPRLDYHQQVRLGLTPRKGGRSGGGGGGEDGGGTE